MKQLVINSVGGAVGVIIGLIGEWTPMLSLFFTVLAIDYVSGVMAAVIEKKVSSSVGLKGLIKKFAMVLIVVLAHQLDQYAGTHLIQSGVIMFFIVNELISITENYGRIGLPLPPQIKNVIAMLKERK